MVNNNMTNLEKIGNILTGNWRGKIGNDIVEEYWSKIMADSIMCMFRWEKNEIIEFYEFVTITKLNDQIMLKIKHFNADMTGWEDKNDFVHYILNELTDSKVIFGSNNLEKKGSLIYERKSKTDLIATLKMSQGDKILKFEFKKIP